jgi:hypothetical protein
MISSRFTRSVVFVVVVMLAFAAGVAFAEHQPHMRAALRALHNAKQQLDSAEPDKGGHRVKAIQLVNDAINEVEAGIQYDNKH